MFDACAWGLMADAGRVDDAQGPLAEQGFPFLKKKIKYSFPSGTSFFFARWRDGAAGEVDLTQTFVEKEKKENDLFITRHGETMI